MKTVEMNGQAVTRQAYTSQRQDIVNLTPAEARDILDCGCSNGNLGKALCKSMPGWHVEGIKRIPSIAEKQP